MKKRITSMLLAALMLFSAVTVGAVTASAASDFKTSDDCIEILKLEEGFSKKPYWDYSQYTVGYGSTCPPEMYDEFMERGITEAEAEALLRNHLVEIENQINTRIIDRHGLTLTQSQFDALVLFSYNCGTGWSTDTSGTLYNAVIKGKTGGELIRAFALWCNAGGEFKDFLMRRRLSESNMYLNGVYSKQPPENYTYVIYDANGGSTSPRSQGYDSTETAAPFPIPTYSGYTFVGWYTQRTGGTKVTVLDASVAGATLYARWADSNGNVPEAEEMDPVKVKVTTNDVNIRKGPGTNYAKIGTAQKGQELTIVELGTGSGLRWGRFDTNSWICLTYTNYDDVIADTTEPETPEETEPEVPEETEPETPEETEPEVPEETEPETPEETEPETPEEPQKVMGTVNVGSQLCVRKGPGTGYAAVKYLRNGTRVEILEQKTVGAMVWGRITDGWISMDYVKLDANSGNNNNNNNNSQQPEANTWTGTVINCNELRIRSGAGTQYAMVGYVKAGTRVTITERKFNGSMEWGRISNGWISLDYVKLDTASNNNDNNNNQTETPKWTGTVVNCDFLRIRKGAGTNYAQVGQLSPGTRVSIFEKKTNGSMVWGRISNGWISLDYVKMDEETNNDSGNSGNNEGNGNSGNSQQTITGTVKVNGTLRVRSGPGTSYAVAGYLNNGATVTITEKKTVGSMVWGRISNGWISMDYVVVGGTNNDTNNDNQQNVKTVTASCLCVRSSASTTASIVGYLYSGTKVTILETKTAGGRTWGKISNGWIAMDYVR